MGERNTKERHIQNHENIQKATKKGIRQGGRTATRRKPLVHFESNVNIMKEKLFRYFNP